MLVQKIYAYASGSGHSLKPFKRVTVFKPGTEWIKQTQNEDGEEQGWKHMDVTTLFIS